MKKSLLVATAIAASLTGVVGIANADVLCIKSSLKAGKKSLSTKGLLVTSTGSCPKGTTEVLNMTATIGPQGPTGPQGPAGAQGPQGAQGDRPPGSG